MNHPTNVAVGTDNNFFLPALFVIWNGNRHSSRDFEWNLGYFEGDLSPENIEFANVWAKSNNIHLNLMAFQGEVHFDERRWLTRATFLKLVMADSIGGPLVWLDSDLLLRDGWDRFLEETGEIFYAANQHPNRIDGGFNAGVMYWSGDSRLKWKEILEGLPTDRHSSDQIIFNVAYGEQRGVLSPAHNAIWGNIVDGLHEEEPHIIHYGGAYKPWHLPTRLRSYCLEDGCVWAPYLMDWERFMAADEASAAALTRLFNETIKAGKLYFRKDGMGRIWGLLLHKMGLWSPPIVRLGRIFSHLFPAQILHPIHSRKAIFDQKGHLNAR